MAKRHPIDEYPSPDYWRYAKIEVDGANIDFPIHEIKDLKIADIRNRKYDLDSKAWCLAHYFWTAEQAALISFGRDPDKVVMRDEYDPDNEDDEDYKKHLELWDHVEKRLLLIEDAQKNQVLPKRAIPPAMFIEWGTHMGFRIPQSVQEGLKYAERDREAISQGKRRSIFPGIYLDPIEPDDSEQNTTKASPSQQKRLDNNLKKILLALLIKSNLINSNSVDLSKMLAKILETKAVEQGDNGLVLSDQTIKQRLDEAHDLLK